MSKPKSIDLLSINFSRDSSDFYTSILAYQQIMTLDPEIQVNLIVIGRFEYAHCLEKSIDDLNKIDDKGKNFESKVNTKFNYEYSLCSYFNFYIQKHHIWTSTLLELCIMHLKVSEECLMQICYLRLKSLMTHCLKSKESEIQKKNSKVLITYHSCIAQDESGSSKSYDHNMVTKQIESLLELGQIQDYFKPNIYKSSAKVLFSGLGADEVFGGYARYATAHKRGLQDLQDEISLDLDRLWERNFNRDDRAISKL